MGGDAEPDDRRMTEKNKFEIGNCFLSLRLALHAKNAISEQLCPCSRLASEVMLLSQRPVLFNEFHQWRSVISRRANVSIVFPHRLTGLTEADWR
jgi:hypothetical protein